MLRLPTIRSRFAEVAYAAQREQLTYRGFLAELLMAKCDDRDRRRSARRIAAAKLPREKSLADFDYSANPHDSPVVIGTLASCAWVAKGEPLCLIGDSGTGKSHLLIGLGTAAAIAGHRVKYILAAKLVNELVEAADERQQSKTIARTAGSTCCVWTYADPATMRRKPIPSGWWPGVGGLRSRTSCGSLGIVPG